MYYWAKLVILFLLSSFLFSSIKYWFGLIEFHSNLFKSICWRLIDFVPSHNEIVDLYFIFRFGKSVGEIWSLYIYKLITKFWSLDVGDLKIRHGPHLISRVTQFTLTQPDGSFKRGMKNVLSVLAEGTVNSSWGSQRRLGICGDDVADEKNIPYRYASAHNHSLFPHVWTV